MTFHGLRETVISSLFSAGHAPPEVAHRSGHRCHKSMEPYMNIRGEIGKKQQLAILGSVPTIKKNQVALRFRAKIRTSAFDKQWISSTCLLYTSDAADD